MPPILMDAHLEHKLPEGGLWKGPEQTAWSCSWEDQMHECVLFAYIFSLLARNDDWVLEPLQDPSKFTPRKGDN